MQPEVVPERLRGGLLGGRAGNLESNLLVLLHDGGDRIEDPTIRVTLLRLEMLDVPRLRDAERRALGHWVGSAVEEDVVVDQVARNLVASSRGRLDGVVVQLLRSEEQLDSS